MLEKTKQLNELSAKFHKLLVGDFAGVNINNKIKKWSELSWGEFVAELSKQKLAIGGKLKEEWLERFERMSIEATLLRGNIT
ncbi:MAG: hypothetical protein EBT39_06175, partial [Sphingobacteriia bacterium]|nr:hypothetical protein [Candidatus Fonsibacter lacus]